MFIESIDVKDFRNIEKTGAELAPLTIIRGANHQGKSSIAQAIQIALTCRAEGTDGQGRGANDKIRVGAKKAEITMLLRGKTGLMPLAVTYGPNRTGRHVTSDNPPPFLNWMANNTDRLSCALDSDYFVRQNPEDQKTILASLVLPSRWAFPQDIQERTVAALGNHIQWDSNPLALIDGLYERAYDARRSANATLKGISLPTLPTEPPHSAAAISAELKIQRANIARLAAERKPSGSVLLGRLQEQLAQVEAQIVTATTDADELRTALTDVSSNILSPAELKRNERCYANRRTFDNLDEQLQELARQLEDQRQAEAFFRQLASKQLCPTCHQVVSADFIDARVAEAREAASGIAETQREVMRQQKALGNIEEAEDAVATHKSATARKALFQTELAGAVATLADCKEKQRNLSAQIEASLKEEDAPESTAEIDAVNRYIAELERDLAPALRYDAIRAEVDESLKRRETASMTVAALEKLVAYYGKDGIKAELIQQHIATFTASVNSVLEVWGYRAELSIEPYEFTVTGSAGTLPLKELSGSERMMFGVALQTAIAAHAKIGMVLVDKADMLFGSERNRLFSCLGQLITAGTLEQAIVLVADDRTDAPQKTGVAYFAAQGGKLVSL